MSSETANVDLSKLKIKRESTANRNPDAPNKFTMPIIVLLIVGVGFAGYYFFKEKFSSAIEVETTTVSLMYPSQANALLTASGYVVAHRKAAIASKGTGKLVFLNVEEGDVVKKGDVIARIEFNDVDASLLQTKAQLNVAKATLEQVKAEQYEAQKLFERVQPLFEAKLISLQDYESAEARLKRANAGVGSAEAGIQAAEANVTALEVQLENTFIRAPFDGTILNKNAEVGEIVAPFAASASSRGAVVTIADMKSIEVEADVSESNIERVTIDSPCEIVLDAVPAKRYRGFVHKIVPTADRGKATVLTKIRFVEYDERVLPEMSAKISFLNEASKNQVIENAKPILTVRQEAIIERDGKKIAFLVKGEIAEEVSVQLGQTMGSLYEVTSGLAVNDKVVVRPNVNLVNGAKILIKE
ncbi:MAG: efflux RND transporter periplasmic adaptor subunit [Ignavibacteriales bacterium]|nr:efflux RND transporter periplasmic adaptor subunit [Ignavibacteriales bacterium]